MILVDTSIWIDHLRTGDPELGELLRDGQVLAHPWVTGELALGHLSRRSEILGLLHNLPQATVATDDEVLTLIDEPASVRARHRLCRRAPPGRNHADTPQHGCGRATSDSLSSLFSTGSPGLTPTSSDRAGRRRAQSHPRWKPWVSLERIRFRRRHHRREPSAPHAPTVSTSAPGGADQRGRSGATAPTPPDTAAPHAQLRISTECHESTEVGVNHHPKLCHA